MALLLTADGSGLQRVGRGLAFAGTAGPSFDTDAATYIAAVEAADGQALEAATQTAINTFVVGCKADGNWNAIKAACILAGARTLSGALVPLAGPAPTNNNFVSADYNRKTGLAGNGSTKYLNSNRANNADPQNSQHVGIFVTGANSVGYGTYIGCFHESNGGNGATYIYNNLGSGLAHVSRRNGSESTTSTFGAPLNFVGLSRASSTTYTARVASASQAYTQASQAPIAETLNIFRINRSYSNLYNNARLSFYSIGEAVDLALLDARVTTLMADLAAAIP